MWGAWKSLADTSVTQNVKITNDDGTSLTLTNYDLLNTTDVSNFDGYVTTASNIPTNINNGYFKRKYRNGYIQITFSPHSTKDIYRNSYNAATKNWVGWEKLITQSELESVKITDTGWLPYTTLNGVKQNLQFKNVGDNGFDCSYRIVTHQGVTTKHLRVNVENIAASGTVLAKLPAEFIKSAQPFSPRLPRNKTAATVVPRANGDIIAITPDNWIASDYLYGSFSWTD